MEIEFLKKTEVLKIAEGSKEALFRYSFGQVLPVSISEAGIFFPEYKAPEWFKEFREEAEEYFAPIAEKFFATRKVGYYEGRLSANDEDALLAKGWVAMRTTHGGGHYALGQIVGNTLNVPEGAAGLFIGRGGSNIKMLSNYLKKHLVVKEV